MADKPIDDPTGKAAEDPTENELLDRLRQTTPTPGTPKPEPSPEHGGARP